MPKYLVTPQMYPGVYRADAGFFRPGEVVTLNAGEIPSKNFEPMDAEAQAAIEKAHKIKKPIVGAPEPKKAHDDKMSVRELSKGIA
jgi:hypothetical protein